MRVKILKKRKFSYPRGIFTKNKYNARPTYVNGKRFDSKREVNRYKVLLMAEKGNAISDLQCQPRFNFPMGFSYIADFSYIEKGKRIVEDVKGQETYAFQLKRKCFNYFYSHIELRIIK